MPVRAGRIFHLTTNETCAVRERHMIICVSLIVVTAPWRVGNRVVVFRFFWIILLSPACPWANTGQHGRRTSLSGERIE